MKPTSEILERINRSSTEHKDGVFTRLYRYLLREDIYYAAYQKLYANRGATTKGINNDTADGFSEKYVQTLIQELKEGTYRANPVRREYIPKKNGKMRPLGIPSFRDKLLQEVVRMILEAIYEPVFDSHSHGLRGNGSREKRFAEKIKEIEKGKVSAGTCLFFALRVKLIYYAVTIKLHGV